MLSCTLDNGVISLNTAMAHANAEGVIENFFRKRVR